ncbi:MAG: transposase, partial [Gaiellaceae bacterium]
MAPPRIIDPQGLYHVMSRGNFRQTIFPDEDHAERYLFLLARVVLRRKWIVVDWCLMPNHYHLVIQLTDGGLSDGMRELNGCYSKWSNVRSELTGTGHLVRNRFKSVLIDGDDHLLRLLQYVPNNPVKAKLTGAAENWKWSGYRATAGLEHPRVFHRPSSALAYFDAHPGRAQDLYVRHVTLGVDSRGPVSWSDQEGGDAWL